MRHHEVTRRWFASALLSCLAFVGTARAAPRARRTSITDFGALADGSTINTKAIQAAIDAVAKRGGTVVVPAGVFVSGALFLKPRVNLVLERGAVIRCSTDLSNFPPQRTRIEGHFEERFTPALLNAKGCDGLKISGEGTLDGAGRPIWDLFWKLRNAAPDPQNFPNLGVPRARLALIEDSKRVTVEGVTFKDSQFWNLHLYRCQDVLVRNARFQVPDDYKQAPSSDGVDIDSCQRVTIDGCVFSVTDDCIAMKGTKGPGAMQDRDSPPVENIHVRNCHFRRGHQAVTCGSEASIVRHVLVENCRVTGEMHVLQLKLRLDTPQLYEDIIVRNIILDSAAGMLLSVRPWTQYKDLKGQTPPKSTIRGILLSNIRGRFGSLGTVQVNAGQTSIDGITLRDVDLNVERTGLAGDDARAVRLENVVIDGEPFIGG